jgi:hypothetical protein
MHPKQMRLTSRPDFPNRAYCMAISSQAKVDDAIVGDRCFSFQVDSQPSRI